MKNLRLPLFKQQNWRTNIITSYRRFVLFVIVIRHDTDWKIIIIFPTKSHCTSTLHTNLVPFLGLGCDYDVCSISTCFQAWSFLIQVMGDGLGTKLLLNLLNFSVAFWHIKIATIAILERSEKVITDHLENLANLNSFLIRNQRNVWLLFTINWKLR